jgi:hypothetical protein
MWHSQGVFKSKVKVEIEKIWKAEERTRLHFVVEVRGCVSRRNRIQKKEHETGRNSAHDRGYPPPLTSYVYDLSLHVYWAEVFYDHQLQWLHIHYLVLLVLSNSTAKTTDKMAVHPLNGSFGNMRRYYLHTTRNGHNPSDSKYCISLTQDAIDALPSFCFSGAMQLHFLQDRCSSYSRFYYFVAVDSVSEALLFPSTTTAIGLRETRSVPASTWQRSPEIYRGLPLPQIQLRIWSSRGPITHLPISQISP